MPKTKNSSCLSTLITQMSNLVNPLFENNQSLIINREAVHRQKLFEKQWLSFLPTFKDIQEEATFEELIKWFSENSNNPDIEKGLIMRKPHQQGTLIIQVFLDARDEVVRDDEECPIGRKFIAKTLDEELLESFEETNLIIVE